MLGFPMRTGGADTEGGVRDAFLTFTAFLSINNEIMATESDLT